MQVEEPDESPLQRQYREYRMSQKYTFKDLAVTIALTASVLLIGFMALIIAQG